MLYLKVPAHSVPPTLCSAIILNLLTISQFIVSFINPELRFSIWCFIYVGTVGKRTNLMLLFWRIMNYNLITCYSRYMKCSKYRVITFSILFYILRKKASIARSSALFFLKCHMARKGSRYIRVSVCFWLLCFALGLKYANNKFHLNPFLGDILNISLSYFYVSDNIR